MIQNIMFLDAMVISKSLLIFYLKNPFSFKDDFWARFVTIWIVAFSFVSQIIADLVSSKNTSFFYICSGIFLPQNFEHF
jgi:hypothetical protein